MVARAAYVVCLQGKLYYGSYMRYGLHRNIYGPIMRRKPMQENRLYHVGGEVFFFIRVKFKIMLWREVSDENGTSFRVEQEFNANSPRFYYSYNGLRFHMYGKHAIEMTSQIYCFRNGLKRYQGDFIPMEKFSKWPLAHDEPTPVVVDWYNTITGDNWQAHYQTKGNING